MLLVDREEELAVLEATLAETVSDRGQVVLLTGEAGIGKTSLIGAFLAASRSDVRILRGACEDLSVPEPLAPLYDLLQGLAPALLDAFSNSENLLSVFSEALTLIADHPVGTIVVIEDLHWADDATIDFIRFASRRLSDLPVCMVVSARAEQAASRQLIRRAFGDVPGQLLKRIVLGPLSEEGVTRLCRESGRDPDHVYDASGGNAFFVSELLNEGGNGLPPSIRDAVLARVDRLGTEARTLLEIVSVFPRQAEIDHVLAVLPPEVDPERNLDQCLDLGLLRTDGETVSFAHELAREAVLSSLSPLAKRRHNRRLYDHLTSLQGISLARRLHHAEGAGDKAAVAELAPEAARAAAEIGSHRQAAAFSLRAVEAAGAAAGPDLLEAAAWFSYMAGEHSTAADFQLRAMNRLDDNGPLRRGEALRKLSRYHWVRSDHAAAFACISEAIALLSGHPGPELALAFSSLSQILMTAYRFDEVAEPAGKAIAMALEFDRPDIRCHALNNLGMSKSHADPDQARAWLSESLALALDLDDPDNSARALINWGTLEYDRCAFRTALEIAERSARFSGERELDGYYRYSLGMIARARHKLGRWDDVTDIARRGFDPDDRVPKSFNFNGAIALFMHAVRTGTEPDPNVRDYLALFDHPAAEGQRIAPYSETMAELAWLTRTGLDAALSRLRMAASEAACPEAIGGVHIWLERLGAGRGISDLARFPAPYRLELEGDRAAAAKSWLERDAPYEAALTLAFGTTSDKREALGMFRRFGDIPAVARLNADIDDAPKPRGRPPASGPFGLTKRQLAVLQLVEKGLTNAQIGESLFISPKTVDHHVSAILEKLDVGSRGEAAAVARRREIL